jgi:hypothetical protein
MLNQMRDCATCTHSTLRRCIICHRSCCSFCNIYGDEDHYICPKHPNETFLSVIDKAVTKENKDIKEN